MLMTNKLTLPVESRMQGDLHVRFGGRLWETYHRKVVRRPSPSLQYTTGNTYPISFLQSSDSGIKINNLFFIITGNSNKATHLRIRNGKRTLCLTIHNITDGQRRTYRPFDMVNTCKGSMNEYKIVYYRNQLAYLTIRMPDVLIMHRNKILNFFGIKHLL